MQVRSLFCIALVFGLAGDIAYSMPPSNESSSTTQNASDCNGLARVRFFESVDKRETVGKNGARVIIQQVPVLQQQGASCGYHAFKNACLLVGIIQGRTDGVMLKDPSMCNFFGDPLHPGAARARIIRHRKIQQFVRKILNQICQEPDGGDKSQLYTSYRHALESFIINSIDEFDKDHNKNTISGEQICGVLAQLQDPSQVNNPGFLKNARNPEVYKRFIHITKDPISIAEYVNERPEDTEINKDLANTSKKDLTTGEWLHSHEIAMMINEHKLFGTSNLKNALGDAQISYIENLEQYDATSDNHGQQIHPYLICSGDHWVALVVENGDGVRCYTIADSSGGSGSAAQRLIERLEGLADGELNHSNGIDGDEVKEPGSPSSSGEQSLDEAAELALAAITDLHKKITTELAKKNMTYMEGSKQLNLNDYQYSKDLVTPEQQLRDTLVKMANQTFFSGGWQWACSSSSEDRRLDFLSPAGDGIRYSSNPFRQTKGYYLAFWKFIEIKVDRWMLQNVQMCEKCLEEQRTFHELCDQLAKNPASAYRIAGETLKYIKKEIIEICKMLEAYANLLFQLNRYYCILKSTTWPFQENSAICCDLLDAVWSKLRSVERTLNIVKTVYPPLENFLKGILVRLPSDGVKLQSLMQGEAADSSNLAQQYFDQLLAHVHERTRNCLSTPAVLSEEIVESTINNCKAAQSLIKALEQPIAQRPIRILIYGQQGTGKTTLARAIAQKSHRVPIWIEASLVSNEFRSSGEQGLADIFNFLIQNKTNRLLIIIDEIDTITGAQQNTGECRESPAVVLSRYIDRCQQYPHIAIIGITWRIDLVPLDLQTRFGPISLNSADKNTRVQLFLSFLIGQNDICLDKSVTAQFIDHVVNETKNMEVRDLEAIVAAAIDVFAIQRCQSASEMKSVTNQDLEEAVKSRQLFLASRNNNKDALIPAINRASERTWGDTITSLNNFFLFTQSIYRFVQFGFGNRLFPFYVLADYLHK